MELGRILVVIAQKSCIAEASICFLRPVLERDHYFAVCGIPELSDLLLFLFGVCLFFLSAFRLDARDGPLQPMFYVLPEFFFGLRCGDRIPMFIQWDVVAWDVLVAELLGNEVIKQALMAGMRTRRVAMIGTG